MQGGEFSVAGTLVSPAHPDIVFRLLEDFDGVADVFSAIHESRKEVRLGQLQLIQVQYCARVSAQACRSYVLNGCIRWRRGCFSQGQGPIAWKQC